MRRSAGQIVFGVSIALLLGAVAGCSRPAVPQGGNQEPNTGAGVGPVISKRELARMEGYVAELQAAKKVVKSFQGPSGETIDCVDIYSQPALKRPGADKIEVQLAPRNTPPSEKMAAAAPKDNLETTPNQLYLLTGETCPEKTAPMARLTMETLKRFKTLDEFFRKKYIDIQKPFGGGGSGGGTHEYAHAARTVDNWGAESVLNLWSPYVEKSDEFSLSQIWVVRGSGSDRETVEAGWQVYRDLYGDWRSHLFIYFTPDNYGSGGCYNLSCSGFVQINNTVYIGGGFTSYSSVGGDQKIIKLLLYKDGTEGSWWLRYGDTWVGYYPRSLFDSNGLRNHGARIDFGGEIINTQTDGRHTRTDMGSGHWPYEGFGYAAYQRALRYVDTSNYYQRASGLTRSVTNNMCYDLDLHTSTGSWEEYFYFGGSGYNTSCP